MIVDIFTSEQGKRLFGFIAAGATLGAISGSIFTVSTIEHMAPFYLMIGAALMLEVAVFCVRRLSGLSEALASRPQADQVEQPIGGTLLGGFRDALSSSYLLNVSLFLLLYAVTSTFLYFQQAAVVSHSFESRAAQTAFFASVDLGVNLLTLGVQLFLTGRILRRFGVATTLSLLPVFSVLGSASAWSPCCQRCHRSSDFNCSGAPAILPSRDRRAKSCSRCFRARIATKPRALSTPRSIGWAIRLAPGRTPCSPL
jgi:AAA family ATP:ADP antiporter